MNPPGVSGLHLPNTGKSLINRMNSTWTPPGHSNLICYLIIIIIIIIIYFIKKNAHMGFNIRKNTPSLDLT